MEVLSRRAKEEEALLDGDFPLGNSDYDVRFAAFYFSVLDMAEIQLGYSEEVKLSICSDFDHSELIRKAFLCEPEGNLEDAQRYYSRALENLTEDTEILRICERIEHCRS